jgi:phosphatidylglycerol:prolipoprotein diacylglycerol transferase
MENYVILFGIKFNINPIAFTIPIGEGWSVYWYGIIIALGFLAAIVYGYIMAKKMGIDIDRMLDVVLVTTPVAILCARAYYVIFDTNKITSIKEFFGLDGSGFSGLAIYGAVIGAFICGFVMCKLRKINFLDMFDLAAVGFILAQGVGRWGNFVNQEVYGAEVTNTALQFFPFAVYIEAEGTWHYAFFFYESMVTLTAAILMFINAWKNGKKPNGVNTACYFIVYGLTRSIMEPLRDPTFILSGGGIPWSLVRTLKPLFFLPFLKQTGHCKNL